MKANEKNANGLLVDPVSNCNDFERTDAEVEVWLIFCVMVAGHEATTTARKIHNLFLGMTDINVGRAPLHIPLMMPIGYLRFARSVGLLEPLMRSARTGCYTNYRKTFDYLIDNEIDGAKLRRMSLQDLIKIPSVGLKTASFFIMSTRRDVRMAALDTHLLKYLRERAAIGGFVADWLREEGVDPARIPKATPANAELYAKLERVILKIADMYCMTPQDFDFAVWSLYAKAAKGEGVESNMARALQGN
jgi:thermostable 8-oxoguanine DNA glycosylase